MVRFLEQTNFLKFSFCQISPRLAERDIKLILWVDDDVVSQLLPFRAVAPRTRFGNTRAMGVESL